MKITRIILLTVVTIMATTVACQQDFLEVQPAASLSESELASRAGLEGALIGAYSPLLGKAGFYSDASNWFWGSVLGGDANKGSDPGDQSQVNEIQTYAAQTNNGSIEQKYRATYEGVARTNAVLKLIPQAPETVPEDVKTRIAAEARFLRGHYYFDLKRNFNDVPYVDETWDEVTPVQNNVDIWPKIEEDFKFAFDNLPEVQNEVGRANKWAAAAYLGKTYLFQEKWTEAKAIFDQVIASGVNAAGEKYRLLDDYAALFRSTNDNNAETVFSVQAAAGTGSIDNANPAMVLNFPHGSSGPERPGGCCGFNQPSFDLANSFRTSNGLPLLDNSYNSPGNQLATDMGLSSSDAFTPDTGPVDPRLDHSIGRRGIPYLDWGPHPGRDWIRNQPNGGPYSPKKFVYYKSGIGVENDGSSWTPGYTAVNYYIIRYADVLLMAAEAEAELGNLPRATELVNQVRDRADNAPVLTEDGDEAANYVISLYPTFSSKEQALDAIYFERKLELSGEGHRFYDLVRWGIAAEELNRYLDNERIYLGEAFAGAKFTAGQDEYLPIPQNEIDLQGTEVLTQNPGY